MEKEFIPYEQALALKELGFDEPCFGYYDGNHNLHFMYDGIPEKFTEKRMGPADSVWVGWISAPLHQQAFRWFSEKFHLYGELYTTTIGGAIDFTFQIRDLYSEEYIHDNLVANAGGYWGTCTTYHEAQLECLRKLIKMVKNG